MSDIDARSDAQAAGHHIDRQRLPEWGAGPDGRMVRLRADADLTAAFDAWAAARSAHERQFTGKIIAANGAPMFRRYCRDCGIATTQHPPHRTVANTGIAPIDEEKRAALIDGYEAGRRQALDALLADAAARQQGPQRDARAEYLAGPVWRVWRAAVIDRCEGVCEGCRDAPVEEVHHLTYSHFGRELLFQLVGLCAGCHLAVHGGA